MKKQLKKIVIGASLMLFAATGVSFAHDEKVRHHQKTYTCYKATKHHRHWPNHHFKPWRHHQDRYICTLDHHHYYHSNRKGHWKRSLYKHRRLHRDRYIYIEDHHHHKKRHHRKVGPRRHFYHVAKDDPRFEFRVIW